VLNEVAEVLSDCEADGVAVNRSATARIAKVAATRVTIELLARKREVVRREVVYMVLTLGGKRFTSHTSGPHNRFQIFLMTDDQASSVPWTYSQPKRPLMHRWPSVTE